MLHLASSCIELCGSSIFFMPFALRMRPVVRFVSSACNYCARLPICWPKAIEYTATPHMHCCKHCSFLLLSCFLLLPAPFYVATQRSVECATTKTSNKCWTAAPSQEQRLRAEQISAKRSRVQWVLLLKFVLFGPQTMSSPVEECRQTLCGNLKTSSSRHHFMNA